MGKELQGWGICCNFAVQKKRKDFKLWHDQTFQW